MGFGRAGNCGVPARRCVLGRHAAHARAQAVTGRARPPLLAAAPLARARPAPPDPCCTAPALLLHRQRAGARWAHHRYASSRLSISAVTSTRRLQYSRLVQSGSGVAPGGVERWAAAHAIPLPGACGKARAVCQGLNGTRMPLRVTNNPWVPPPAGSDGGLPPAPTPSSLPAGLCDHVTHGADVDLVMAAGTSLASAPVSVHLLVAPSSQLYDVLLGNGAAALSTMQGTFDGRDRRYHYTTASGERASAPMLVWEGAGPTRGGAHAASAADEECTNDVYAFGASTDPGVSAGLSKRGARSACRRGCCGGHAQRRTSRRGPAATRACGQAGFASRRAWVGAMNVHRTPRACKAAAWAALCV